MQQQIAEWAEHRRALHEYGDDHRYWLFLPAWQIESAAWNQAFGEHDPACVIGFYLSRMFKKPQTDPALPPAIKITPADAALMDQVLRMCSEALAGEVGFSRCSPEFVMRCLVTGSGLQDVVPGGLVWVDDDFCKCLEQIPDWLTMPIIRYWCGLRFDDEDTAMWSALSRQAQFICRLVFDLPADDDTIVKFLDQIHIIKISSHYIENHVQSSEAQDFATFASETARRLCGARQSVFGNVLPLTFDEAGEMLVDLTWQNPTWLTEICRLSPGGDDSGSSPLWVIPPGEHKEESPDSRRDLRTDVRAVERYRAYRFVYDGMQEEHLTELATAWWAFFIASQARAFSSLGIPTDQMAEAAEIASALLPNQGLEQAIRLALDICEEAGSLDSRQTAAILRRLLRDRPTPDGSDSVVEFAVPAAAVEKFLITTLGASTWQQLENQTKRDLIEAERLFSVAYRELGAGRADWGSLIALYARAVEAEIRTRLKPIIESATAAGACTSREPTLGGCISAIREAKRSIRIGGGQGLSETERELIVSANAFFAKHSFLEASRNRAAHGNREQPIGAAELLRWREAMFHHGLFAELVSRE
jgi:hypothetical protein